MEVELSLIAQTTVVDVPPQPWTLAPSVRRVAAIDEGMRSRLAESLAYLAEVEPALDADSLAAVERRLKSGPASPWLFCLYSKLVADVAKSPRGDVVAAFRAMVEATSLSAEPGIVLLSDQTAPTTWWDQFRVLFDTDRRRPFRPTTPSPQEFAACKQDIEAGLAVFKRADPDFHAEVQTLVRMIVLGAPGSDDPADKFNGASTFFLWGAALLNADLRRSCVSIIDLLVHESSHGLLFGISAEGTLTENSGTERYDSPLRSDQRPIDGIFHACFVATRVHLAMTRILESSALTPAETKVAIERAKYNGDAALNGIKELDRHARLTELGEQVLGTLRSYWAANPAH